MSIVVDYSKFDIRHTYREITGNYTFNTHTPDGDVLYGIDVFIRPKFRGCDWAGGYTITGKNCVNG